MRAHEAENLEKEESRRADTRSAPRFPLAATAGLLLRVDGSEREYVGLTVRDISRVGAFLLTRDPPPLGTHGEIDIVLRLPILGELLGDDRAALHLGVDVVRAEEEGVAVRFDRDQCSLSLDVH